jgi:DnaK suppressor protein
MPGAPRWTFAPQSQSGVPEEPHFPTPGMEVTDLKRFRRKLEELQSELQTGLENKGEATAPVQLDTAIGRLSRMDAMQTQQMARELKARQEQGLLRVQNALRAIEDGTYGQCRRCRKAISHERLEVRPDAMICMACAEHAERR